LGRTPLVAEVGTFELSKLVPATPEASDNEPTRLLLTMEAVEPVHWMVRAFLESGDVGRAIRLLLPPRTLFVPWVS
jgi:hypothetical protein